MSKPKEYVRKYVCNSCGSKYTDKTLQEVDLGRHTERLDLGYELVPAGECRKCGAFCYPENANLVIVDMTLGKINAIHTGVPWLTVVVLDRAKSTKDVKRTKAEVEKLLKAGELTSARLGVV